MLRDEWCADHQCAGDRYCRQKISRIHAAFVPLVRRVCTLARQHGTFAVCISSRINSLALSARRRSLCRDYTVWRQRRAIKRHGSHDVAVRQPPPNLVVAKRH